jgi:hypothetical protein
MNYFKIKYHVQYMDSPTMKEKPILSLVDFVYPIGKEVVLNPPISTSCPIRIIILFFIYLNPFRVEKIGGINLQGHFSGRSQFGKLGSGTF